MKTRILAFLVVATLPLMAFDCITNDFSVAVNLDPFVGSYQITGNNLIFGGTLPAIHPADLYDQSYQLTGASVYDIRIGTSGQNLGKFSVSVTANGIPLLGCSNVDWTAFRTPQSLLTSTLITKNPNGISELVNAVVGGRDVVLSGVGTVENAPGQSPCTVTIYAYVQAYGTLR